MLRPVEFERKLACMRSDIGFSTTIDSAEPFCRYPINVSVTCADSRIQTVAPAGGALCVQLLP